MIMSVRTTRFAQSEADLSWTNPTATPTRAKPADTTGSEYGEPLKADSKARITSWARAAHMANVPEEPHLGSNESHNTEDSLASGSATLVDDFESDEEIEAEMAARQVAVAKKRFEAGKYASAETMLRKAYDKALRMHKRPASLDVKQLSFDIARACFEQHKYDDSYEMCSRLLKELPQDDSSRVQVLDASHLLTQIHLCRREFLQARTQCRQTMNGRKKFEGKSTGYYATVALMVAIYEAQDDEDEALAWEGSLPDDYVKPTFHNVVEATARSSSGPTPRPASNLVPPVSQLTKEALRSQDDLARESAQHTAKTKHQANPSLFLGAEDIPVRPLPPPLQVSGTARKEARNSDLPSEHNLQPPKLPRPFYSNTDRTSPQRKSIPSRSVSDPVTRNDRLDLYDLPRIPKLPPLKLFLDQGQQAEALRLLAMDGWDPTLKGFDGNEALLTAAAQGNDLVVQLLLQGWSQDVKRKGIKALSGRRRETLTFQPIYVDTTDMLKQTSLHHAASQGHASTSQLLLEYGASGAIRKLCDMPDCLSFNCSLGLTPLEFAVYAGHLSVVQVFLALGAAIPEPGHKDESPLLHNAAARGERDIFALLLASGMDIMSRDTGGDTPLHCAAGFGQENLVIFMLQQRAEIDALNHEGRTALHLATAAGSLDCVETLVEKGASLDRVDYNKWPPLHFAAQNGHANLIPYFMSCGVDLNARDRDGRTAMHLAAAAGMTEFIKRCRIGNADVKACDKEGHNILHLSASAGSSDLVALVLDMGLSVDARTHEGRSALMLAAAAGQSEVLELLITRKADINAKGADGRTAFQYAVELQSTEMAQRLRYAGAEYCKCATCDAVLAGQVSFEEPEEWQYYDPL
jgi:ankyrin repeat protein